MDFCALFENFADSKLPFQCLELFLKITNAYRSLSENCKPVVTYLDKTLKKPKGCDVRSLVILKTLINQCSPDLFVDNCINWAEKLSKIIQTHDDENIVKLACDVTLDILPYVTQNSELNRQFTNTIAPKLLNAILKSKEKTNFNKLKCLRELMKLFRGPCRQFTMDIENFTVKELFENENIIVQHEAARCLVLIPSLGAAELTTNVSPAWEMCLQKILGSLREVLVMLLEPVLKEDSIWKLKTDEAFDMSKLQLTSPVVQLQKLQQRFHALSYCLCEILRTPFQSIANISFDDIIGLISQIVTVTPLSFADQITFEDLTLASILPFMHEDAFMILQAVIETGRRHLMPYTNAICKMLVVGFEWTFENTAEGNNVKPLTGLRRQLYSTVQIWVQTMTTSSGLEQHTEQLLLHIINDLRNPTKKVQLQTCNEEKNRRKRKRGQVYATVSAIGASKDNPLNNVQLCISALSTLKTIHYTMGAILKPVSYQEICNVVVHLVQEIQKNERHRPAPYDNPDCRKELFSALLGLVVVSPRGVGSPLQIAIGLFSKGVLDNNHKVANVCMEAKSMCMQLIHPRYPSMELNSEPVEKDSIEKQIEQPNMLASFSKEKRRMQLETGTDQEQTSQSKKLRSFSKKNKNDQVETSEVEENHKLEDEMTSKNGEIEEVFTISEDDDEIPEKVVGKKINGPVEIQTSNRKESVTSDIIVQEVACLSPNDPLAKKDALEETPSASTPQSRKKLESSRLQSEISSEKRAEMDNIGDIEILSASPTASPPKKRKLFLENEPSSPINTSADIKLVMSPLTPMKAGSQEELEENQLTVDEMLQDFVSDEPKNKFV